MIDGTLGFAVVDIDVQLDGFIWEPQRFTELRFDTDGFVGATFSTEQSLHATACLLERVTRVPGNVVNWLSPLGVKLEETLIEDCIVGGVQLQEDLLG